MKGQTAFAAVLQLGALMEDCTPARLTFPDGRCFTGQVVGLDVPGGSYECAWPLVALQVYSGAGLNRRVDRVVIELREDALPIIEPVENALWPAWGPGSHEAVRRKFSNMPRFPRTPQVAPETAPPSGTVAATTVDPDRLAARKKAETKIEVVFEQLTADEELALLFRILRARGWSTDRADTVLAKARWNG